MDPYVGPISDAITVGLDGILENYKSATFSNVINNLTQDFKESIVTDTKPPPTTTKSSAFTPNGIAASAAAKEFMFCF